MTPRARLPLQTRLFQLLAGLSLAALTACSATPTPLLDTATPPAAAPSATHTAAVTATKAEATTTNTPTVAPSATPTKAEATETPTKAATATATATDEATATAPPPVTIFNTKSQWDISSTTDTSGCATAISPLYGLVLMTPLDGGFQWYNTAQDTLTFTRVSDGVYTYNGPYTANTGTASLQVTLTSNTTLRLDQTFHSNAEPDCAHTYSQTGTFVLFDTR